VAIELIVPSYTFWWKCRGIFLPLLLIKAIAAASPETPYAVVAHRTRAAISCALIAQIAANALDFRNDNGFWVFFVQLRIAPQNPKTPFSIILNKLLN